MVVCAHPVSPIVVASKCSAIASTEGQASDLCCCHSGVTLDSPLLQNSDMRPFLLLFRSLRNFPDAMAVIAALLLTGAPTEINKDILHGSTSAIRLRRPWFSTELNVCWRSTAVIYSNSLDRGSRSSSRAKGIVANWLTGANTDMQAVLVSLSNLPRRGGARLWGRDALGRKIIIKTNRVYRAYLIFQQQSNKVIATK